MAMELTRLLLDGGPNIYTRIAQILEIEADGGDDPGEVLRWAIQTALKEQRAEALERKAQDLKQEARALRAP